jgi:hypothetical protein
MCHLVSSSEDEKTGETSEYMKFWNGSNYRPMSHRDVQERVENVEGLWIICVLLCHRLKHMLTLQIMTISVSRTAENHE